MSDDTLTELTARRDAAATAYYEGESIMSYDEFDPCAKLVLEAVAVQLPRIRPRWSVTVTVPRLPLTVVAPELTEPRLALAGALSSGFQAFVRKPAGFGLLAQDAAKAVAAVPFLVFAAPFIIMRNTVRGRSIEGRRVEFVALATIIAGFWSMMSGTFVLMLLETTGVIA